jgi:diacylglycerol kinase family enzyme
VARFVSVIDLYKKGQHLDSPKMRDVVEYRRGRRVNIESDKPLWAALDGELVCSRSFAIDDLPQAIRFAVPQK